MTTDFTSSRVPLIYSEIFDTCSINGDPIIRDIYHSLLTQCNLNVTQLKTIWDLIVGPSTNQQNVTRTNFYKTLALIGWAQQGKDITEKLFLNTTDKELPIPHINDLSVVKNLKIQLNMKQNLIVGLNYASIVQTDKIHIELVPEKKGLFLKYTEYIVSSKRFNSKVTRRYNDFVAFQELLLSRFPYRLVPSLPPKKIVSDAHFLESRRRGLQRWLTLVCCHPTICHDALVGFFLTDQGPDIQHRIREIYRRAPDEFMTSDLAGTAKNLLPADYNQIATSREQIRALVQVVGRLKHLTESSVERQLAEGKDANDLAVQMRTLSGLQVGQGDIIVENWTEMQRDFSKIAKELQPMGIKCEQHSNVEQLTVCERLALILDILVSHKELCERLEKGLTHDHQVALSKMLSLKKRKIQGAIRGTDAESVEKLEAKMLTQENLISNIELRTDFSLYCVYMETQLVFAYLETLSTILNNLVAVKMRSHSELLDIWKEVENSLRPTKNCNSPKNGTILNK